MARYQIDNVAAPIDFQESDPVKRTLQNAKNLLMCRMGEGIQPGAVRTAGRSIR